MHRRRLLVSLGVAGVALLGGLTGLREFDVFHHLAMGRHLLAHGLSGPEPFLYTLDGRPPLPPPHWLGSIILRLAELAGGLAGVVLLAGLAGAATLGLAADGALRPERQRVVRTPTAVLTLPDEAGLAPAGWASALLALVPVALALGAWRIRAVSRPEVLGLACFAWTLHALRHGGRRALWSVPPVALLWAVLHPSVAFGLGAVALALLDALRDVVMAPRGEGGSAARARARQLGLVGLAAAGLAALAPGGALALALGFGSALLVGGPVDAGFEAARSRIVELQPAGPELLLTPVGALLLLVPLGWVAARRRPRLGDALLLAGLAGLAARSVRFIPWAAVAAAPLVGRDLATWVRRRLAGSGPGRPAGARPALAAGAGVTLAAALAWSVAWLPLPFSLGVAEDLFPVRAADLLAEALPRAPRARLWNGLESGGYLEWRLPEGAHVYQDGRLAWPPGEAEAALDGPAHRAAFARLEARWGFDALVVGYPPPGASPDPVHGPDPVADRRRWALVAFDDGGLLYVRRDGALGALAVREYREVAPAGVVPAARLLDVREREALAREYRRALAERPGCAVCRAGLWLAVAARGDVAGLAEADALLPGGRFPETSNPFGHEGLEAVAQAAWAAARGRCETGAVLELAGRGGEASMAYRACLALAPGSPWAAEARQRAERLER